MLVVRGFVALATSRRVTDALATRSHRAIGGLWGASTGLLIHVLQRQWKGAILVVTADDDESFALREDMHAGLCGLQEMEFETQQDADNLEVDIRVQKYKILSSGRIILWDKDQIRKEIDRSPDWWDALVMAFEYPQGGAPSMSVITTTVDGKISSRPATDEEKDGEPDAGPDADETLEDAVASHAAMDSFMAGDDDIE